MNMKPVCPWCGSDCYEDYGSSQGAAGSYYRCTKCSFVGVPNWINDLSTDYDGAGG